MATIKELYEERHKLILTARELHQKAITEDRSMTDEESGKFDELMDKADEKKTEADALLAEEERTARLAEQQSDLEKYSGSAGRIIDEADGSVQSREMTDEEREMRRFEIFLQSASPDRRKELASEARALQADIDISGGYTVPPQRFVSQLIKNVDDMVFMRQAANVITLTDAASLGAPALDNDPGDPTWTAEIGQIQEDTDMSFGKRELEPHQLARLLKASEKLLRLSALPMGSFVQERLAYKFSTVLENAYLSGTGAGQPLGVFVASSDGISTARDEATDNTTTAMTFDGLKNAKYKLKGQYWGMAQWMFHRDGVKQLAKIVDGNTRYLWQDSVVAGEPDRLLGFPVRMSEFVPNTFTTGLYVGILGDFSWYWIVDSLGMTFRRLDELYAETGRVGFLGKLWTDGMPVLEEAFVRVQLG